jgi:histidinol dehydrogenase
MTAPAVGNAVLTRLAWTDLDAGQRARWLADLRPPEPTVEVAEIVAAVRRDGDGALRELTERIDGVRLDELWVSEADLAAAEGSVNPELVRALTDAAAAIRRFHADQRDLLRPRRVVQTRPGVTAWRRFVPLERIGAYVPGGRAPLASSVLMVGVPAQLAGVGELIIATPPGADGHVDPAILAAARLVGARRILRVGGAQAIAALAYGTESVPRVDRIVGAGGPWVTAAKRAVAGDVPIDLPAGPSECVILADATADPRHVALDLLAQAEHGPDSVALVVSDDVALADAVDAALPDAAAALATGRDALETLARHGASVIVPTIREGVALVDLVAPEHVSLQCRDAVLLAGDVRNAGAVFIGPWTPVAAGDYTIGTTHLLPTGGAARAWSGLGVEAFGRWLTLAEASPSGLARMASTVAELARAEGLAAHAASVAARVATDQAVQREEPPDPTPLLRAADPVTPYPAEPSDEALAETAGVDVDRILRADMNTLGGGALPGVAAALATYRADRAVEYGDLSYRRLREALGGMLGVAPQRVIPGAGADELIRLITTLTVGRGDSMVIPTPTFGMFEVEAELAGARVVRVGRHAPGQRQPASLLRQVAERESARLVWLCTPNNPTGDAYGLHEIRALADGLAALVAVDEVYLEFAAASAGVPTEGISAISLQEELPNIVVLRSLSKAYGLAAARVGYLVVREPLAARVDAARLPLPVAGPSEAMALGALSNPAAARRRQEAMVAERQRLHAAIGEMGWPSLSTVTNFVIFRPPDASALADALLRHGIGVRTYGAGVLAGWMRIGARDGAGTDRIIRALREEA